jgi:hypothetical protein
LNEIANTAQTSAKAYYDGTQALAQTISGNVGIDDSTATLGTTYSSHKIEDKTRTNLLNPTLGTTTVNGVTCTANGDGTYTLDGKFTGATEYAFNIIPFGANIPIKRGRYKFLGADSTSSLSSYKLQLVTKDSPSGSQSWKQATYNGYSFDVTTDTALLDAFRITIQPNAPRFNNVIVKPMITTDLSATYDDFVAYSGEGELNANVAEMYKTIETLKNAITELGGTI